MASPSLGSIYALDSGKRTAGNDISVAHWKRASTKINAVKSVGDQESAIIPDFVRVDPAIEALDSMQVGATSHDSWKRASHLLSLHLRQLVI